MAKEDKTTEGTKAPAETTATKAPAPKAKTLSAPEGFKLVNWTFGSKIDAGKFGVIDLEKLSPARAKQLVESGFKYLAKA